MTQHDTAYYETVAKELVAALRGRRSQNGFSRVLGYKSNVVQRWESGQCFPYAATFLEACRKVRADPDKAITQFHGRRPEWLGQIDVATPEGVAKFLSDLRGNTPIGRLALDTGFSRFAISRWLNGVAQPRLHQFLRLIDAASRRLIDFTGALVPADKIPSLLEQSKQLALARESAYSTPWSHGVLRALELDRGRSTATGANNEVSWLSEKLGVKAAVIKQAIEVLLQSGQVQRKDGRLRVVEQMLHVNTGADAKRARKLKTFWSQVAVDRLAANKSGRYGYYVFAASRETMVELREIELRFVREMQTAITNSGPSECVGLYCAQLLDLSDGDDNALMGQPSD